MREMHIEKIATKYTKINENNEGSYFRFLSKHCCSLLLERRWMENALIYQKPWTNTLENFKLKIFFCKYIVCGSVSLHSAWVLPDIPRVSYALIRLLLFQCKRYTTLLCYCHNIVSKSMLSNNLHSAYKFVLSLYLLLYVWLISEHP